MEAEISKEERCGGEQKWKRGGNHEWKKMVNKKQLRVRKYIVE